MAQNNHGDTHNDARRAGFEGSGHEVSQRGAVRRGDGERGQRLSHALEALAEPYDTAVEMLDASIVRVSMLLAWPVNRGRR